MLRRKPPPPPVVPPQQTDGILAAKRARARSKEHLLDAVDSGVQSRQVAERMRELRRHNHFGPQIEDAIVKNRGREA